MKKMTKMTKLNTSIKFLLNYYYKSQNLFNLIIFKNKYIIISLLFMALITFLFNKNLDYFKDLNLNLLSIKSFLIYIIIFYLSYIKFNLIIKFLSVLKSIPFFYKEINKKTNNIETILLFYYIINIFFIIILFLFIKNLTYNFYLINFELGNYTYYYTNVISIILLFAFLELFLSNKFIIEDKSVNLIIVIFNIILTFTPFIFLNFCGSLNYFTIYCESTDTNDFQKNIREPDKIIMSNNTNSVSFGSFENNNSNVNINTPTSTINNSETSNIPQNSNSGNLIKYLETTTKSINYKDDISTVKFNYEESILNRGRSRFRYNVDDSYSLKIRSSSEETIKPLYGSNNYLKLLNPIKINYINSYSDITFNYLNVIINSLDEYSKITNNNLKFYNNIYEVSTFSQYLYQKDMDIINKDINLWSSSKPYVINQFINLNPLKIILESITLIRSYDSKFEFNNKLIIDEIVKILENKEKIKYIEQLEKIKLILLDTQPIKLNELKSSFDLSSNNSPDSSSDNSPDKSPDKSPDISPDKSKKIKIKTLESISNLDKLYFKDLFTVRKK